MSSPSGSSEPQGTASKQYYDAWLIETTTQTASAIAAGVPIAGVNALGNLLSGMNGTMVLLRTLNGTLSGADSVVCNSAPASGVVIHHTAEPIQASDVFTYSKTFRMALKQGRSRPQNLTQYQTQYLRQLEKARGVDMINIDYSFRVDVTRQMGGDNQCHVTQLVAYPVGASKGGPFFTDVIMDLKATAIKGKGSTGVLLEFSITATGGACLCLFGIRKREDNSSIKIWGDGTVTDKDGPCFENQGSALHTDRPLAPEAQIHQNVIDELAVTEKAAKLPAAFDELWHKSLAEHYVDSARDYVNEAARDEYWRQVMDHEEDVRDMEQLAKAPGFVAARREYFTSQFRERTERELSDREDRNLESLLEQGVYDSPILNWINEAARQSNGSGTSTGNNGLKPRRVVRGDREIMSDVSTESNSESDPESDRRKTK
jgi:hypothetical protein